MGVCSDQIIFLSLPTYVYPLHSCFVLVGLGALSSMLQILTQEDWNVVLYNGMASTSPWASLYFVALMTFGNYVLFNLLVAILVEGFQAEVSCHWHFFHGGRMQI